MTNQTIPQKYLDLFQKPAFAHLATLMPDGSPQVTPVWFDYDGKFILVNTARSRQKFHNVKRNAQVAIEIMDPDNPYRYIQVRGKVADITTEGANQHIDKLSKKYTGNEHYQNHWPGEVRVIVKIELKNL
jgi:PPOX class probable F420-dependent enzyme